VATPSRWWGRATRGPTSGAGWARPWPTVAEELLDAFLTTDPDPGEADEIAKLT
jgi:hypothetical protein